MHASQAAEEVGLEEAERAAAAVAAARAQLEEELLKVEVAAQHVQITDRQINTGSQPSAWIGFQARPVRPHDPRSGALRVQARAVTVMGTEQLFAEESP